MLGHIIDAAGPDVLIVSVHGEPQVLAEGFANYFGSGNRSKLVEYPVFDIRLLKFCLQRTTATEFGNHDPFWMTEFPINRLKGDETRDWMASRPAFRRTIIRNDLSMPGLVDVVANIIGVLLLVVVF